MNPPFMPVEWQMGIMFHMYESKNLHVSAQLQQDSSRVSVWCGLMYNKVIGLFFFTEKSIISNVCLDLLQLVHCTAVRRISTMFKMEHHTLEFFKLPAYPSSRKLNVVFFGGLPRERMKKEISCNIPVICSAYRLPQPIEQEVSESLGERSFGG
ncbi:unnamed protein product [Larinioides sclopetarius]|uniref:Uncharacterized protein n=1 Tax=Larinioides sclopetarius TaxID=280406 RepID=A0AAV2A657_9ARAC